MGAYLDLTRETGQNHFITSVVDEAPALMGIGRLEQLGCVGKMIDVGPKGYVSAEDLREAITPRTAVVSLSWANALTGVVQPVEDLAQVCEDRGIFLHLDASHVMGRLVVDVGECAADFVSFSGDLMHGPKGIGGLWMKAGRHLSPFIVGGADQGGQRAGALPVPLVMGLAQAARESVDRIDHVCTETVRLRDRWETEVKRLMPEAQTCFQGAERLPHVSCICFPGVSNEALLYYLNQRGVFASIGGGALQQIALLLTAKGFDEEMAQCAVSFSLSYETTDADIDYALSALDESLHQLRRLSKACWE
jgi:cysteine desulfurase